MKISIGTKIKDGPWGGGNLFAINLKNYLKKNGHLVVHDLNDDDIDIILITEPRRTSESSAYSDLEVKNYLKFRNYNSIVVHRINECDERKKTNYVNKYLINANKTADATVFVSNWLKNLYLNQGLASKNIKTIMSGSDSEIFNNSNLKRWNKSDVLKIVTHHWGGNWNKGFDIYSKLDKLLNQNQYKNIEFHYIGNIPSNFKYKNMILHNPLSGLELSDKLKNNHIYITASLNEPSGNHHIEAAQCGLPILYINSGGIPEYCEGYGVMFNEENFEEQLNEIILNYETYFENLKNYKFNSLKMCNDYLLFFEELIRTKDTILKVRTLQKNESKFSQRIYDLRYSLRKNSRQ